LIFITIIQASPFFEENAYSSFNSSRWHCLNFAQFGILIGSQSVLETSLEIFPSWFEILRCYCLKDFVLILQYLFLSLLYLAFHMPLWNTSILFLQYLVIASIYFLFQLDIIQSLFSIFLKICKVSLTTGLLRFGACFTL